MKIYIVINSQRQKVLYATFFWGLILYELGCIFFECIETACPGISDIVAGNSIITIAIGEIFSISACMWIVNSLCGRILWRTLLKKYLSIPDLNGRWRGELISNYPGNGERTTLIMELHIKQTLFEISCTSEFFKTGVEQEGSPNSKSYSDCVEIDNSNPDEPILKFSFRNDSQERGVASPSFQGFNVLNISGNTMNGIYFTNRPFKDRGVTTYTGGTISLRKL